MKYNKKQIKKAVPLYKLFLGLALIIIGFYFLSLAL